MKCLKCERTEITYAIVYKGGEEAYCSDHYPLEKGKCEFVYIPSDTKPRQNIQPGWVINLRDDQ